MANPEIILAFLSPSHTPLLFQSHDGILLLVSLPILDDLGFRCVRPVIRRAPLLDSPNNRSHSSGTCLW